MVSLLQSFTAVLDEFGVSHGRAKRAALCAGEGLIIVCPWISTLYSQLSTPMTGRIYIKSSFSYWCWWDHQCDPGLCRYDDSYKMVSLTHHQNLKQYNSSWKHRRGESFWSLCYLQMKLTKHLASRQSTHLLDNPQSKRLPRYNNLHPTTIQKFWQDRSFHPSMLRSARRPGPSWSHWTGLTFCRLRRRHSGKEARMAGVFHSPLQ